MRSSSDFKTASFDVCERVGARLLVELIGRRLDVVVLCNSTQSDSFFGNEQNELVRKSVASKNVRQNLRVLCAFLTPSCHGGMMHLFYSTWKETEMLMTSRNK